MERCLNLKFVFGTAVVFKRSHFNCVQDTAQQFTDPSATLRRVRVAAIRRVVAGVAAVRDEAFNPLPRAHDDQVERLPATRSLLLQENRTYFLLCSLYWIETASSIQGLPTRLLYPFSLS